MKKLIIILFLSTLFAVSCQIKADSIEIIPNENIKKVSEPKVDDSNVAFPVIQSSSIYSKIGNVEVGNDCVRLIIGNSYLEIGDKVQIVLIEGALQKVLKAEVIEDTDCSQDSFGNLRVINPNLDGTELIPYLLKLTNEKEIGRGFGIGIVNFEEDIQVVKGLAHADLDKDGKNEYFRGCTSSEGLHLTVWKGKPLIGRSIWHSYYGFSYDTKPTCEDKDFEDHADFIQSKIGIVDGQKENICFRTKNGNLDENTPVSIVTSLRETPQQVLSYRHGDGSSDLAYFTLVALDSPKPFI